MPIVPAELAFAGDGTPFSPVYGDVYHSAQGALEQARHVFLAGNDLPARWQGREVFSILETGFGIGLNFLATWQVWRKAGRPCRLHFISVEKHPFRRNDLQTLLARHPELAEQAAALLPQWPLLIEGFHRLHFEQDRITLTLLFGAAEQQLPKLVASVDAIYLDGFAPAKNPDIWSPALLAHISRHGAADTTLATWSVAGELRRSLESLGWQIERRPGFAAKREMLTARRSAVPPAPKRGFPSVTPLTFRIDRRAIVIGAGLAGCAISERLAARGWCIDLIERRPGPAQEASGNPAGVILPRIAKDDALAARLSRACLLYAVRRLQSMPGVRWDNCGVFQIAKDAAHETLQREGVERLQMPEEFVRFLTRAEAERQLGHAVAHGGWWFPAAGWVSPGSVCQALLTAAGNRINPHYNREAARIDYRNEEWHALDPNGKLIASAPQLVLANAAAANRLLPSSLPLITVRGQVSFLPKACHPTLAAVNTVLCRSSYLTPPAAGTMCFGASFDPDDNDTALRLQYHQENLARLDELLPGCASDIAAATLDGRVGFRTTTPHRLPLAGAVADIRPDSSKDLCLEQLPHFAGLHVLLGLGARGMVWGPLLAELLAAQICNEPLPLEKELMAALDPCRVQLQDHRRRPTL
jgi:tRNA 5-methylaminomethyl-2-thiouridine biosynthesis bifunctional protein